MTSIISPRPITRAVIRPLSICSQFLRFEGHLGWLSYDTDREEWNFRRAFGLQVFADLDFIAFNSFEATTAEDLREFVEHKAALRGDIGAYYDRTTDSGD